MSVRDRLANALASRDATVRGDADADASGDADADASDTPDASDAPDADADANEPVGERDTRPPTDAVVTSLLGGFVAFLVAVVVVPLGGLVVGASMVLLAAGLLRSNPRLLVWAAGVGAGGVALAGYAGGSPEALVTAAVALAFAWDVGDHGLSLGDHVGHDARARRNVAVHAGVNLLVGGMTAGVVYGAYAAASGGQPVTALALLLFGGIVLASAFR